MTDVLQQNPTQTDLQQVNRFSFVLSKLPETVFFCQKISVPGITLPPAIQTDLFANIYHPGSKMEFDPTISLTFKVNEHLKNYLEVWDWMTALGQPRQFGGLRQLQNRNAGVGDGEYSDLVVTVRTPKGSSAILIKCHRCFPTNLTGLTFETDNGDVNFMLATVQFSYTTLTFETI